MTPGQILVLVRDVLVLGALGFVIYRIYVDGENRVRQQDMQAVEKQLATNTLEQRQWAQDIRDAEAKRIEDMEHVSAAIAAQRAPVIVRVPAGAGTMPRASSPPATGTACPRGPAEGPGVDIRPALNALEFKYERALADCRAVLAEWPK